MNHLSFLELIQSGESPVVSQGVVSTEELDELTSRRPLHGRGMRFFQSIHGDELDLASLLRLADGAVRVFPDSFADTAALAMIRANQHVFGSLDVKRGLITWLETAHVDSVEDLVRAWVRVQASKMIEDTILVEIDANHAVLEGLVEGIRRVGDTVYLRRWESVHNSQAVAPRVETEARRREDLIEEEAWLSSAEVAAKLGSAAGNASQQPMRLRKAGALLGVWHAPQRAYFHPPCQFDTDGVLPQMKALLDVLPVGNGSGWKQAQWLYTPHALLDAERPADVLPRDPERVLIVARRQFQEAPDAGW